MGSGGDLLIYTWECITIVRTGCFQLPIRLIIEGSVTSGLLKTLA